MEITHVWDVNPEEAQKFASLVGAKAVKNYDDMVGKVDVGTVPLDWRARPVKPGWIEESIFGK